MRVTQHDTSMEKKCVYQATIVHDIYYAIIFNLCFCRVSNVLLPREEQILSPVPLKLLITKASYQLSLNKYSKVWLNTNLAKRPNLFTVELQELLQIYFWETYRFNSPELFFHLHLHSFSLLAKTWLSARNRISPLLVFHNPLNRQSSILEDTVFNFLEEQKSLDFVGHNWNRGKCGDIHTYKHIYIQDNSNADGIGHGATQAGHDLNKFLNKWWRHKN